jgi:hypothetical protein
MFGLFSKKNYNECPIDPDMRLWMENSFLWLTTQFGHDNIATKEMLHPTPEHFPIRYDGSKESLTKTAEIIALQMEIDINEVNLNIYEQNIQEFSGDLGHRIWTEVDKDIDESLTAGLYFDKNDQGKYDILIEKKNLSDGESLVATLSHDFSHIKILGEKRLDFNDEQLTDLTPVVFGLGIFNANSSFKEYKSFDSYGHTSRGYLKQREWGYALALYAFFRQEEDPDWIKFLTPNLKSDFRKSMDFIYANTDKVFIEEYNGGS